MMLKMLIFPKFYVKNELNIFQMKMSLIKIRALSGICSSQELTIREKGAVLGNDYQFI